MKYEAILNNGYIDNFFKLKYGFLDKDNELKDFKQEIKDTKKYIISDIEKVEYLFHLNLQNYVKKLLPNSFGIEINFALEAPYYSSDDDEFYIIQNPCLKEKVFKVPIVRGSSIKGALVSAVREIINEKKDKQEYLKSFFRVFGVGNDEFRKLMEKLDENEIKLFFLLHGIKINYKDDIKDIFKNYQKDKAQKGRVVFYPIYFDKLSLEIINPHNRKTKAGTNPIHYEVVPRKTEGILQLIYIPFDGILEDNRKIKEEAEQDLEFLKECIKRAFDNGIGAKTKLGWGKANIKDEDIKVFWSER